MKEICKHGHNIKEVGRNKEYQCKKCIRDYSREYYHHHKEKAIIRLKKYARSFNGKWLRAIVSAERRGFVWSISKEDYKLLLDSRCYYCGGVLNPVGISLDRLNNSEGYLIENVVSCCRICNQVKMDCHTPEETLIMIRARDEYRKQKGV
jgi:hypothetical protein